MFETYIISGTESSSEDEASLVAELDHILPNVDLVVVADYGHGVQQEGEC